jgi:hypothetical protein
MDDRLTAALERLDAEQAFRLLYAAYEYLASEACAGRESGTRRMLERLRAGDEEARRRCWLKSQEEQQELEQAREGKHHHPDQTRRETMLNEAQQSLYWVILPAVARGVVFDEVIREGWLPTWTIGAERHEVVMLAMALHGVARSVQMYNHHFPAEAIDVREVALADLRQMAEKDYLAAWLRQRLGLA